MNVYSLYDKKLARYLTPFYSENDMTAHREMVTLLQNKEHPITIHAEDYTLFHVGEFDDETGFTTCDRVEPSLELGALKVELIEWHKENRNA